MAQKKVGKSKSASSASKALGELRSFEIEYPLSAPYSFEGFTTPEETIEILETSLGIRALAGQSNIATVREGQNVPGFTDILIHVGNTQSDTQGCILAAKNVDRLQDPTRLVNSRALTDWLYDTQTEGTVFVRSK